MDSLNDYATLTGFSTGVPTQTTPTFTPTTLRNIEQTFLELQSVAPMPTEHQNQAGFVPPLIIPSTLVSDGGSSSGSSSPDHSLSYEGEDNDSSMSWSLASNSNNNISTGSAAKSTTSGRGGGAKKTGRQMGGRRPMRNESLTPEEENRRQLRRERNKMAAARCRKRRLDHTNTLLEETEGLEGKRSKLQDEIEDLKRQKEELEFILDAHKVVCTWHKGEGCHGNHKHRDVMPPPSNLKVKQEPLDGANHPYDSSGGGQHHPRGGKQRPGSISVNPAFGMPHMNFSHMMDGKTGFTPETPVANPSPAKRPNSLAIKSFITIPLTLSEPPKGLGNCISEATGIAITTPSTGINFNLDSLLEGGTGMTPISTGLTPLIPTCSTQQRSSGSEISSPSTINPPKLVSL